MSMARFDPEPPTPWMRVGKARFFATWVDNKDRQYPEQGSRRGALQLVFCDIGTPRREWNVYDELKSRLIDRGVPAEAVRFMHDAKNDREKAELFAQCRSGSVGILIGSTEKMGVGTNVQTRAVALHHVDCPWRPADIEQRVGRILRQGNLNREVEVLRYVTESLSLIHI